MILFRFAGNKCCLRDVAQRFGIGQTSAFRIINRVVDYLIDTAGSIIRFPVTEEEKLFTAEEFYKVHRLTDFNIKTIISCYCRYQAFQMFWVVLMAHQSQSELLQKKVKFT